MTVAVVQKPAAQPSYLETFQSWPLWVQVLIGTVVAAVVLWIFAKILKWTMWVLIVLVVVVGLAATAYLLLN